MQVIDKQMIRMVDLLQRCKKEMGWASSAHSSGTVVIISSGSGLHYIHFSFKSPEHANCGIGGDC